MYESFDQFAAIIPPEASAGLARMRAADLLSSYQTIAGITSALERISARLRRPVNLASSVAHLEEHYESFHSDFRIFFPELQSHADAFHRSA